MGRKVDIDDLVGTSEIVTKLGLKRAQVVLDWMNRYDDFPAPLRTIGRAHVWRWQDVERWLRAKGRL